MVRHFVQVAGNGCCVGKRRVDVGNEPLPVFGVAACQVEEVGDVVGAENGLLRVKVGTSSRASRRSSPLVHWSRVRTKASLWRRKRVRSEKYSGFTRLIHSAVARA